MSRRGSKNKKNGALGPIQGPPRPARDPIPGRRKRPDSEAYHVEEYGTRWFKPALSERPDVGHQIQAVRIAFEHMEDAYRMKCAADELDPANAEFRLRGLLDTLRTLDLLKFIKETRPDLMRAIIEAKKNNGSNSPVAQMGVRAANRR